MAKKKVPAYKLVLHPNRWLFWALSACLIAAAGLVAYINISEEAVDVGEMPRSRASKNWQEYANMDYGFSLNLPLSWKQTAITGGAAMAFASETNPGELITVTVKTVSRESSARASLAGFTEEKTIVGGIEASKYSYKDSDTYVLFVHENNLYVFKSNSKELDKILETFSIL